MLTYSYSSRGDAGDLQHIVLCLGLGKWTTILPSQVIARLSEILLLPFSLKYHRLSIASVLSH